MASHRPLVMQVYQHPGAMKKTLPFKDGARIGPYGDMAPVTTSRLTGHAQPEDWEYRILGRGNDSGIAVIESTYSNT